MLILQQSCYLFLILEKSCFVFKKQAVFDSKKIVRIQEMPQSHLAANFLLFNGIKFSKSESCNWQLYVEKMHVERRRFSLHIINMRGK